MRHVRTLLTGAVIGPDRVCPVRIGREPLGQRVHPGPVMLKAHEAMVPWAVKLQSALPRPLSGEDDR